MSTGAAAGLPSGPGLTSFVGRRRELAEARALMSASRLTTLVGPGGVGKTRLALELSFRSRKAFRDGAWLAELAAVEDSTEVGPNVAAALHLPDQSNRSSLERLADFLRERRLLLVLDNCEHLIGAVAALAARLLDAAPGLRILATSREPLGILGEQVFQVPPLATPSGVAGPEPLEGFESVRLLLDRARNVDPEFELTDGNRSDVAQLCQMLDGIPLAIELAASRLRSVSVGQLVDRLDRRFDILTGGSRAVLPRQQTLRALIDWSYELCTPAEQLLWGRLSVFPGGFDLGAAEEVCGFGALDPRDVLDVLDHLVAKSLVVAARPPALGEGSERVRYHQLMTVREYGAELLEATGETAQLRRRQRDHCLGRAAAMVGAWAGPGQAVMLEEARRDHANFLSALEWSATVPGEESEGARLAALLRYHWIAGGKLSDGRRWLDRFLALAVKPGPERGETLWAAAWVCLIQGDRDAAERYLAECREVAQRGADRRLTAHADHWEALLQLFSGRPERAIGLYQWAIAVHRSFGDTASALTAEFQLAMAQTYAGQPEEALATCDDVLSESDRHGERWTHAYAHWVAGLCHWHRGEHDAARRAQIAALEIQRDFRDGICTALTIEQMAWTAASDEHDENAVVLLHAAEAVWKGLGTTIAAFGPHIQADSEQTARLVRKRLGQNRLQAAISGRAAPTKEAAIELALSLARADRVPTAAARPPLHSKPRTSLSVPRPASTPTGPPLTKREAQVAELVAQGMSNKEIAATLVVSPRTVDGHVERMLAKLGFTSRTQIAAWVAGHHQPA